MKYFKKTKLEIIKEIYLKFLKNQIKQKYTIEYIGNHLNQFLTTEGIDREIKKYIPKNDARKIKSTMDIIRGKLAEEITKFLLNEYFKNDKDYSHIRVEYVGNLPKDIKELVEKIRLHRNKISAIKKPDMDLIAYSTKYKDRFIILSVKGTARERIGQFLSNIFIFDPNCITAKYGKSLYYFNKSLPKFKMMFICFDMAKKGDFSFKDEEEARRKRLSSVKQLEVYLIDDDPNIGYGVFVLNNLYKLHKVGSFSSLVAKLKEFFG